MRTPRGKRLLLAAAALAASTTLTACGATATPAGSSTPAGQTAAPTTMTPPSSVTAPPSASAKPVAITHIHAIARDPSDGTLLLATHEGLYAKEADGLTLRGPVMDLMGFTVSPDGTFYASGHPGLGAVDLPQPLGLIRSTDRGRTWQVTSRGGQSDFHALTAGPQMVVGFDGALRTTSDGKQWADRGIPAPPRSISTSPTSGTLVATTEKGAATGTAGKMPMYVTESARCAGRRTGCPGSPPAWRSSARRRSRRSGAGSSTTGRGGGRRRPARPGPAHHRQRRDHHRRACLNRKS